jgi:lipoyl(octanoyl) transferase
MNNYQLSIINYQLINYQWMGRQSYEPVWQQLRERARAVADGSEGEIIFSCEHEPVYTTGKRGVDNRLNAKLPAPVVHSDRGGEMTFHGPGQLMLYPVINLRQRSLGVKQYVYLLEQSCIDLLRESGVHSKRKCGFPGVWTERGKIAALGVRVSKGVAFHGMALNVDVDVDARWFAAINPCGLQSGVANMSDFIRPQPLLTLSQHWQRCFLAALLTH